MELPGSTYLYTMAALGMTFVGFTTIVLILRQVMGRELTPFDSLLAHIYMELGLLVSIGSMLPSLFAIWGFSETLVWRLSSAISGFLSLLWIATYPHRRRVATGERLPRYVQINSVYMYLITGTFLSNAFGIFGEPKLSLFATADTAILMFAAGAFLQALNKIIHYNPKSRSKNST